MKMFALLFNILALCSRGSDDMWMFQLSTATTTLSQGSNVYSNIINLTTLCQNRGDICDYFICYARGCVRLTGQHPAPLCLIISFY